MNSYYAAHDNTCEYYIIEPGKCLRIARPFPRVSKRVESGDETSWYMYVYRNDLEIKSPPQCIMHKTA